MHKEQAHNVYCKMNMDTTTHTYMHQLLPVFAAIQFLSSILARICPTTHALSSILCLLLVPCILVAPEGHQAFIPCLQSLPAEGLPDCREGWPILWVVLLAMVHYQAQLLRTALWSVVPRNTICTHLKHTRACKLCAHTV